MQCHGYDQLDASNEHSRINHVEHFNKFDANELFASCLGKERDDKRLVGFSKGAAGVF